MASAANLPSEVILNRQRRDADDNNDNNDDVKVGVEKPYCQDKIRQQMMEDGDGGVDLVSW